MLKGESCHMHGLILYGTTCSLTKRTRVHNALRCLVSKHVTSYSRASGTSLVVHVLTGPIFRQVLEKKNSLTVENTYVNEDLTKYSNINCTINHFTNRKCKHHLLCYIAFLQRNPLVPLGVTLG
jgi:predicted RND superfamily exporter protein